MPALSPDTFERLAELPPEIAASQLLAAHKGDGRGAEKDVWDTWQKIVGGEPGRRSDENVKSESAQFCMALVRHIAGGSETPEVARTNDPCNRRRRVRETIERRIAA